MSLGNDCEITTKGLRWARSGHPWIYRDDLAHVEGESGDVVRVTCRGRCLGSAFLSLESKITLRWIERGSDPPEPNAAFWLERLRAANDRRESLARRTDAYRVVHDASDGMPGLVVDRYGSVAVLQGTIPGMERLLPVLVEGIQDLLQVQAVVARNDVSIRDKEGLPREVRVLRGRCPDLVWVHEDGPTGRIDFPVDPVRGQKTGVYLDQRDNRWRVSEIASGSILDAFSYTGLFALGAARGAREVVAVDGSQQALDLCRLAAERNGFSNIRCVRSNVFDYLKAAREAGTGFDTVILDPPAFAKSRRDIPAAVRGYRELNRRAMEILRPGGILVTCSCSYNLGTDDFLDLVRRGAADVGRDFLLLERRGQAEDHPVCLLHPESGYLKCFILRRIR
jgi:23S rRNA (cytosine1962-C5)-methyltransferase